MAVFSHLVQMKSVLPSNLGTYKSDTPEQVITA